MSGKFPRYYENFKKRIQSVDNSLPDDLQLTLKNQIRAEAYSWLIEQISLGCCPVDEISYTCHCFRYLDQLCK
jgi:hypothetical protein